MPTPFARRERDVLGAGEITPWRVQCVELPQIQRLGHLLVRLGRQLLIRRPGDIQIGVVDERLAPDRESQHHAISKCPANIKLVQNLA